MREWSIKGAFGIVAGLLSCLVGGVDVALKTLIFFMIIDFVTGTVKAIMFKELDARKSGKGFTKKVMYLLVVAVAFRIDVATGSNGAIRLIAIYGYSGTELYSITENLIIMDCIPEKIAQYFKQYSGELMKK